LQNKGEYSGTTGRGVLLDRNKVAQVFNYGELGGGRGRGVSLQRSSLENRQEQTPSILQ